MPGARKGMPGARVESAKKESKSDRMAAAKTGAKPAEGVNKYMPNQGHGSHANIAATQGTEKLLKKASLLQKLLSRKESSETRIRLAEIWIDLKQAKNLDAAKECLETCLKKDPADPLCARRVLTPLLLELGEQEAAAALLARYSDDTSAMMLCSGLLLALVAHSEAESEEAEASTAAKAEAAFAKLFECNWHACALLAATATGESPIPEQTVTELREARVEKLAKGADWPGSGGVSEAILLSEVFSACAGVGTEEDEDHEDAWPGLDGVAVWLSASTLEKFGEEAPTKCRPMPSDEKRHVRVLDGVLAEVFEELEMIVMEAAKESGQGEEGEEGEEEAGGEEEEEEGEEEDDDDGEEDEIDDESSDEEEETAATASSSAAAASSSASASSNKRGRVPERVQKLGSREDFDAWKAAKRAKLTEKLARKPPGGQVSDEEESGDDEE